MVSQTRPLRPSPSASRRYRRRSPKRIAAAAAAPYMRQVLPVARTSCWRATVSPVGRARACVLAPMISGLSALQRPAASEAGLPILAHPAMAGAARVSPPALIGKLFRLAGAMRRFSRNHGGRFQLFARDLHRAGPRSAAPWGGLRPAMPVPAGEMTLDRVDEMVSFYGRDTILLIGGAVLGAAEGIEAAARICRQRRSAHRMSVRKASGPGRWQGVEIHEYKQAGSAPFREVSRQVLFSDPALSRRSGAISKVAPGGHSTLERHEHMHAVMILVGRACALVGDALHALAPHDLVHPAVDLASVSRDRGLGTGFPVPVNAERDRPRLPGEADLAELRKDQRIAAFIRT